jgi:hypothetical protein
MSRRCDAERWELWLRFLRWLVEEWGYLERR